MNVLAMSFLFTADSVNDKLSPVHKELWHYVDHSPPTKHDIYHFRWLYWTVNELFEIVQLYMQSVNKMLISKVCHLGSAGECKET